MKDKTYHTFEEISEKLRAVEEGLFTKNVSDSSKIVEFFSSLSSKQVEPKTLNKQKEENSSNFNNQLSLNIEETISQQELRQKRRERNPLYQNWKEVCSHLVDSTMSLNSKKNSQNIQSNSRKIRRILNNEEEFQKSLRDHKSETYDAIIVDLLELNRHTIDELKTYSENINDYFKSKTGQYLFDLTNTDHNNFTKVINSDKFFKYYEYGYHSKETEKSFDLKIDRKFLETFKDFVYDNLEQHHFNLNSKEICESPNIYEIIDSSQHMQHIKKKMKSL